MVMIIFSLIEFFNVKVSLFFSIFDPFMHCSWVLMIDLLFVVSYLFCLYVFFPLFFLLRRFRLYFWL